MGKQAVKRKPRKKAETLPAKVKKNELPMAAVNQELLISYLDSMGLVNKMTQTEKIKFTEIARAYQLNPFKREIYCYISEYTDQSGKSHRDLTIVTGYESYIKRAERTGKLNGWNVETKGEGLDMSATITIYRKDWQHPFAHTVLMKEYASNKKIWKTMPTMMLRKVATGTGFRLCFPDEMGGMPYMPEEIINDTHVELRGNAEMISVAKPATINISTVADDAQVPQVDEEISVYTEAVTMLESSQKVDQLTERASKYKSYPFTQEHRTELNKIFKRRYDEITKPKEVA